MINAYTILIVAFLTVIYLIETIADIANIKNISGSIPAEFKNCFDKNKYILSQNYLKAGTKLSLISSTFFLIAEILFIFLGGFNAVDIFARSFGFNEIISGLIFAAVLLILLEILKIPFEAYRIFVIEEKFGFNRMSVKTFIMDLIKSAIIGAVIGGAIFSLVIWFFMEFQTWAWFYAFLAAVIFELLLTFVYPVLIMPIFNKYTPLEDGDLKRGLEEYARGENFKMKGLFKMDGSKRSSKTNAFFTGFGKFRRIVLFDTLIEKYSADELINVLAHEMGHFKLGHIIRRMILSFIIMGLMFYLLSLFINSKELSEAFLMKNYSIYSSIIFFGFLFSPISFVLGIFLNILSRKDEYAADAYAVKTYKKPDMMINALKKLSVDNLSNLNPHKIKVFLEYSHPPVIDRIEAIRRGCALNKTT
jgi:STE24 endopeptidase